MASVATCRAELKPKVRSVASRSLSIVLGTPTMGTPMSISCAAMRMLPSPPMLTTASTSSSARRSTTSRERSTRTPPSLGTAKGLPRLLVPRMVPPMGSTPRTDSAVRGRTRAPPLPRSPSNPVSIPSTSQP